MSPHPHTITPAPILGTDSGSRYLNPCSRRIVMCPWTDLLAVLHSISPFTMIAVIGSAEVAWVPLSLATVASPSPRRERLVLVKRYIAYSMNSLTNNSITLNNTTSPSLAPSPTPLIHLHTTSRHHLHTPARRSLPQQGSMRPRPRPRKCPGPRPRWR
uniref:Uncharacterized protein n=1 Tax=Cacopsylla melanoneura TaxID=428564 RepID=A0A8D8TFT3_9HEMI